MDGIIRKKTRNNPAKNIRAPINPNKENIAGKDLFVFQNTYKKNAQRISPSSPNRKKGGLFKKIIGYLFLILFILLVSSACYFYWKIHRVNSKITSESTSSSLIGTISRMAKKERIALKGESDKRINILLLGIAGEGRAGGNLTDTIMIASIDTEQNKIALLSLPRDMFVEIPDSGYSAKINSIYKYGLSNDEGIAPLKKTVEDITGISINYYLIASFAGFEKFINDINGIVITSERDIYDPNYPGLNYSYELFALEKGTHLLDGSTALKYARERHDDPEGDFGRAKRQQQVMQAIKNRVFSTKVLFNPFAINNILTTLGDNIKTDITLEEMESFLELSKDLDTQNIANAVVDAWEKDSLLKVSHVYYENARAFVLVPRVGNYSEIQDLAKNIFDLDKIKRKKEEIEKEQAAVAIINQSGNPQLIAKIENILIENLNFRNIENIDADLNIISDSTKIIDLTNGQKPFTLDELIKKLPAKISEQSAADKIIELENFTSFDKSKDLVKYDLVVIIGSDLIEPYSFEKSSVEEMNKSQDDLENKEILIQKQLYTR